MAPVNHAPVASAQSVSTFKNTPIDITLQATDADGDTLTYSLVSAPAHGVAVLSGKVVRYTPASAYLGADSFTFKANDGQADSNTAIISITVIAPANRPPQTMADHYGTEYGRTLNVPAPGVLMNDSDADGDAITAVLYSPPSEGTLSLLTDGSFTYTAPNGFSGTVRFSYRAFDSKAYSDITQVSILVYPQTVFRIYFPMILK